jgi:hypothetical protein
MAELVDASDSKSDSERSAGSIPARGTKIIFADIHNRSEMAGFLLFQVIFGYFEYAGVHGPPLTVARFVGLFVGLSRKANKKGQHEASKS